MSAIVKRAVKERDGNQCVDCGMTNEEHVRYFARGLHCHRRIPSLGYTEANCQTVCQCCHWTRHKATSFSVAGPHVAHLVARQEYARSLTSVSFDFDKDDLELIEILRKKLGQKYKGIRISASDVLRIAVRHSASIHLPKEETA